VRAAGQVPLEPPPLCLRQGALKVVGDKFDDLLADEITPSQP
jgi:hypothetical protein